MFLWRFSEGPLVYILTSWEGVLGGLPFLGVVLCLGSRARVRGFSGFTLVIILFSSWSVFSETTPVLLVVVHFNPIPWADGLLFYNCITWDIVLSFSLLTKVGSMELLVFFKGTPQFSLLILCNIFVLGLCGSGLPLVWIVIPFFAGVGVSIGGMVSGCGFLLPHSLAVSWCWSLLLGVLSCQ